MERQLLVVFCANILLASHTVSSVNVLIYQAEKCKLYV